MDIRIRELKNITITPEILKALLDQRSEDVLCRKETQSVVQSNNSHVTEESKLPPSSRCQIFSMEPIPTEGCASTRVNRTSIAALCAVPS